MINGFNIKNFLFTIGFVFAIVFSIALYETGAIHPVSKLGIVLAAFFSPVFFYKLYLMYERRERLKDLLELSTLQMRAIKLNSAMKKAEKVKRDKKKKNNNEVSDNG